MNATVTLATTTFASTVATSDTQVNLTSTSGISKGTCLFANRELMSVVSLTGIGNYAVVNRGVGGTKTRTHSTIETVYLGRPDQFYSMDPQGVPSTGGALVNPHINVENGIVWVIQGDDSGPGMLAQTWQPVTSTQTIGPFGVRVNTTTTPS